MSTIQTDRQPGARLGPALVHALAKNWWLLLLRGIAAIVFGLLAFAWPGLTLLTLILFYGAFALVDGVLAVIAAITGGAPGSRWWLAIVGLLGIAAGLVTFWPHRAGAADFHRRLGNRDRRVSDHRRDQAAQGDR
jgi:uncharacterized membrane protein HdeD (DUF308 family)